VWIPEFFGDVACVHRIAFPYLDVEPRKYRFRVLNGSNARFYHLALKDEFMRPQWDKGLVTPPAGKITDAPQGR
jgi:spore coat protein A